MKKNRYLLLAVAFVASVFLFEYAFLAPKAEMLSESIETKYKALLRDEQFVRSAGMTQDEMKNAINETKDLEERLITEKSEFLASAKLQGDATDLARKAGLNLMTIRPMAPVKLGNYSVIAVYFEGGGNIKQMSDFLKQVEESKLLIKISKLNINITNIQNPNDLKFKLQVSALAKL